MGLNPELYTDGSNGIRDRVGVFVGNIPDFYALMRMGLDHSDRVDEILDGTILLRLCR